MLNAEIGCKILSSNVLEVIISYLLMQKEILICFYLLSFHIVALWDIGFRVICKGFRSDISPCSISYSDSDLLYVRPEGAEN